MGAHARSHGVPRRDLLRRDVLFHAGRTSSLEDSAVVVIKPRSIHGGQAITPEDVFGRACDHSEPSASWKAGEKGIGPFRRKTQDQFKVFSAFKAPLIPLLTIGPAGRPRQLIAIEQGAAVGS